MALQDLLNLALDLLGLVTVVVVELFVELLFGLANTGRGQYSLQALHRGLPGLGLEAVLLTSRLLLEVVWMVV